MTMVSASFNQAAAWFGALLEQPGLRCRFGITVDGTEMEPVGAEFRTDGRNHLKLDYAAGVSEDIFWERSAEGGCHAVRRFRNVSGKIIHLNELVCRWEGITFGGAAGDDYFYHLENPRMYSQYCMGVDVDRFALCRDSGFDPVAGNRWSDPGTIHKRVGRSPYQPFPAILLSNRKQERGIVHGTLSQQVFYHCYEIDHAADGSLCLAAFSPFKAIPYREVAPGEVLTDEWYIGMTVEAAAVEKIFAGYTAELRRCLPVGYGRSSINRHSLVWGSWNDGAQRNISAAGLLRTAEYLKAHFPTVAWLQVDDGYAAEACRLETAHGLGMPYEGENGIDKSRFPDGMTAFYDRVREIGLRPAIWIGGFCPKDTPIGREHPEWFIDYRLRVQNTAPLDVSLPEVRNYMCRALDTLLTDFGCEGMKHDFWSYAFEDSNPLLAGRERSGYEYRRWWLQEIRSRLCRDGYLQTGCDIVMNNPFLGEFFTNYRYGVDIGAGNWECVTSTFRWGTACFATHTGDLFVPNSDAVGMLPGLNDEEALFCLNYCLITASMVEIAGHLEQYDGHPRMERLRKAVCCPNNGQDVFMPGWDYRASDDPPEIFCFRGPFFSLLRGEKQLPLGTLAFFNLGEAAAPRRVRREDLELPEGNYLAWDVWHETLTCWSGELTASVPAHGSTLFSIAVNDGSVQLLDADMKVDAVTPVADGLQVTFAFAGQVVLHYWDGCAVRRLECRSAGPGDTCILPG